MIDYTICLKILILVLFGLWLGFLSAIPIGAVQLEVAKKALNGHLRPAILTALGSATSDLIYGILALFSIGHFLHNEQFQVVIYLLGIIVLSFLLYHSVRDHNRSVSGTAENPLGRKTRLSYLSGFLIAITNPGIIIWWIVGYKLFLDLKLFAAINAPLKILFIISGCAGLGGYLVIIACLLHRMKKAFSEKFIHRMNLALIILLVIVIAYFSIKVISTLFRIDVTLIGGL